MHGYDGVLAQEADWYNLDLAALGCPALVATAGGPFKTVAANIRRLSQGDHQLFLTITAHRQTPATKQDIRHDYDVSAVVLWAARGGGGRAHLDQDEMNKAVEKVLTRIAGPDGDKGHAGRWWGVGPAAVAPPLPSQLLNWQDAIAAAGAAYTLGINYTVTEWSLR